MREQHCLNKIALAKKMREKGVKRREKRRFVFCL